MSLIIRDETANLLVLTCDNGGNFYFGDGTPVSAVTIAGGEIIDSGGFIVHGASSCSSSPTEGQVNVGTNAFSPNGVTIHTIAGRTPIIQIDSAYPALDYFIDYRDPSDPSQGGSESVSQSYGSQEIFGTVTVGSFTVFCQDQADGNLTDPSSQYYDGNLANIGCIYRWT
jgi:hypothetical protein